MFNDLKFRWKIQIGDFNLGLANDEDDDTPVVLEIIRSSQVRQ